MLHILWISPLVSTKGVFILSKKTFKKKFDNVGIVTNKLLILQQ